MLEEKLSESRGERHEVVEGERKEQRCVESGLRSKIKAEKKDEKGRGSGRVLGDVKGAEKGSSIG